MLPASAQRDIEELLANPDPKITIPGLEFTEAKLEDLKKDEHDEEGNPVVNIYVPFFGEYMAAIYRYAVAAASIIAVIVIIIGGIQWIMSGGNPQTIGSAKKRMIGAVVGLMLAVGSYTILYSIDPDLVEFKDLKARYIEELDLDKFVYENLIDPGSFQGTSKAITNTEFDPIFKAFANCANADWRILKVMAFKESSLNPAVVNKYGFVGLFQTKPRNCESALQKYPKWSQSCNDLTNPWVNTAVGAKMLENGLKKVKKCREINPGFSALDSGILLYLNHNSGGGAVNNVIKNGGCQGGSVIQEGIINFWETYKKGKYAGKQMGAKRYDYSVIVANQMIEQGVADFFNISQNGDGECPLNNEPNDYQYNQ